MSVDLEAMKSQATELNPTLTSDECVDKWIYIVDSPNMRIGAYRKELNAFIGIANGDLQEGKTLLNLETHVDADWGTKTTKPIRPIYRLPPEVKVWEVYPQINCYYCGEPVEEISEIPPQEFKHVKEADDCETPVAHLRPYLPLYNILISVYLKELQDTEEISEKEVSASSNKIMNKIKKK